MKSPKSKLSRRNFLLTVSAGGVAVTAAIVTHRDHDAQPGKQAEVPGANGYRLTAHIQNYYRTAKV